MESLNVWTDTPRETYKDLHFKGSDSKTWQWFVLELKRQKANENTGGKEIARVIATKSV